MDYYAAIGTEEDLRRDATAAKPEAARQPRIRFARLQKKVVDTQEPEKAFLQGNVLCWQDLKGEAFGRAWRNLNGT
jgi:hypothetical protein